VRKVLCQGHSSHILHHSSVPTEEYVKRFERHAAPYQLNDLEDVDWTDSEHPDWLELSFFPKLRNQAQPHSNRPGHADPWPEPNVASERDAPRERHTAETMHIHLSKRSTSEIEQIMSFALKYHAEEEVFLIFGSVITRMPENLEVVRDWLDRFPPLVFALLKAFPPNEDRNLPEEIAELGHHIVRNIIRAANPLKIAVLVALEKISGTIASLPVDQYFDLLMLAALSVRSQQLVQEVLLVLNDCRLNAGQDTPAVKYGCKLAVSITFDRAEEAGDECPCNDDGRPQKQRAPPTHVRLSFVADHPSQVKAVVRIDAKSVVRLHSHVRLQATSKATNRWIEAPIVDGVVVLALKGELKIDLFHPPPPEMEEMDWNMYNAGSIGKFIGVSTSSLLANTKLPTATSKAMMDAVLRLLQEGAGCCRFHRIITGDRAQGEDEPTIENTTSDQSPVQVSDHLNASQILAVESCRVPLSLIWGPPGRLYTMSRLLIC
jgi:regulator of nonsense transcripts 1